MQITVVLAAQTGTFETDMNRAAKAAEKRAKEIEKSFIKAGKVIGSGIAIGVTALGVMVKKAINTADEISKLSQKTGVTTQALSQLQYAAGLSGVEDLGASLTKFNRSISEAAQGSKEQAEAFKVLGVNIRNTDGTLKDTETLFTEVAEAFSGIKDGANKTTIAMALFGKSGAELIPLLNEGRNGLARMREEADKLGLTIDERTGKAAEGFNDNLDRLKAVAGGVATRLASEFAPELERITGLMVDTAKETDSVSRASEGISIVFRGVALGAIALSNAVQIAIKTFVGLAAVQNQFFSGNFAGAVEAGKAALEDIEGDVNDITGAYKRLFGEIKEGEKTAEKPGGKDRKLNLPDEEALKAAAKAQKEYEAALKKSIETEEKQRESLKDLIDRLKEESATVGVSRAQIEARAAAELGATYEQKEQIIQLVEYIELAEKSAAATKAMKEATVADTIALEASARAYQRQIDDFGKGPSARRFSAGQNEIDDEFRGRVQALQADSAAKLLPDGVYEQELSRLQKFHQDASAQWADYYGQIEGKNTSFSAGLQETFQAYLDSASNLGVMMADGFLNVLDQAGSKLSDLTARFILWGEGGKEAIAGIAASIAEGLLTNLIDVGIQIAKNALIQQVAITTTTAAGVAATQTSAVAQVSANTAIAASAAPAAAATSLATFGANVGPAIAAILAVMAAAAIFKGGFKDGGYTGNRPTSQVSGVVHGQEFVTNAKATARYRPLLEQMNAGVPLSVPGVPSGITRNLDMSRGREPVVNLRNVNAFDPQVIGDFLSSSAGEKVLINFVGRNGSKIRTSLGA